MTGKKNLEITIHDGMQFFGAYISMTDDGHLKPVGMMHEFLNVASAMAAAKAVRDAVAYIAPETRVGIVIQTPYGICIEDEFDKLQARARREKATRLAEQGG